MSERRHIFLWAFFALQAVCTFFFVGDAIFDMTIGDPVPEAGGEAAENDVLEYAVSFSLLIGLAFTGWELKKLVTRERRMASQLDIASGAFAKVLAEQFTAWDLTQAEKEVALLGIKGFSIAEIAAMRETREGTIKAQNAAIYRKAGVSGRTQLLSHFIEDLMSDTLTPPEAHKPS